MLEPFGQGMASMAPAFDATETAILQRGLMHDGHPILTWNVSNVAVLTDPAENKKPAKDKSTGRIDGFVALCMAIGLHAKQAPDDERDQPFKDVELDELVSADLEAYRPMADDRIAATA